ncbi:MAG: F0F1 ATP synthase subunit epsilon, partial [Anaerolineales bacterium]|nr:F0F1 ATP synthase subunit epsilon [Anaerolineales bacterium]
MRFEFIAQERIIIQDDVTMVVAPGASGVLGILPRHAPLMA